MDLIGIAMLLNGLRQPNLSLIEVLQAFCGLPILATQFARTLNRFRRNDLMLYKSFKNNFRKLIKSAERNKMYKPFIASSLTSIKKWMKLITVIHVICMIMPVPIMFITSTHRLDF